MNELVVTHSIIFPPSKPNPLFSRRNWTSYNPKITLVANFIFLTICARISFLPSQIWDRECLSLLSNANRPTGLPTQLAYQSNCSYWSFFVIVTTIARLETGPRALFFLSLEISFVNFWGILSKSFTSMRDQVDFIFCVLLLNFGGFFRLQFNRSFFHLWLHPLVFVVSYPH